MRVRRYSKSSIGALRKFPHSRTSPLRSMWRIVATTSRSSAVTSLDRAHEREQRRDSRLAGGRARLPGQRAADVRARMVDPPATHLRSIDRASSVEPAAAPSRDETTDCFRGLERAERLRRARAAPRVPARVTEFRATRCQFSDAERALRRRAPRVGAEAERLGHRRGARRALSPARSAIVRATRSTRRAARADKPKPSTARPSSARASGVGVDQRVEARVGIRRAFAAHARAAPAGARARDHALAHARRSALGRAARASSSRHGTGRTRTCRSMRSSSGPEMPRRGSARSRPSSQRQSRAPAAEPAARARVRRRDELEVGAGSQQLRPARASDDAAVLEHLAQRLERAALELGQLVEEQHAAVRERDLAGPRRAAAAEQARRARGVVRRAERPLRRRAARRAARPRRRGCASPRAPRRASSGGRNPGSRAREHRLARARRADAAAAP